MFSKKYVFETKKTRSLRYFRNFRLILFLSGIGYICMCFILIAYSQKENQESNISLFKKPPGLIVVFTGDKGRIPFAIRKAREFKSSNIYITGVYNKNTVQGLVSKILDRNVDGSMTDASKETEIDSNFLDLDYLARNTVENVISTLRYLRERPGINTVLIISNDYHIPRIKMMLSTLITPQENVQFFYYGIETNFSEFRTIKIILKEVIKFARASVFLIFWDKENYSMTDS